MLLGTFSYNTIACFAPDISFYMPDKTKIIISNFARKSNIFTASQM